MFLCCDEPVASKLKGQKRRGKRKHAMAYIILEILFVIGGLSEVPMLVP